MQHHWLQRPSRGRSARLPVNPSPAPHRRLSVTLIPKVLARWEDPSSFLPFCSYPLLEDFLWPAINPFSTSAPSHKFPDTCISIFSQNSALVILVCDLFRSSERGRDPCQGLLGERLLRKTSKWEYLSSLVKQHWHCSFMNKWVRMSTRMHLSRVNRT